MQRRRLLAFGAAACAAPALLHAQPYRSFRDFGARGDGRDDRRAVLSALDSGETLRNDRFEVFRIDGPLEVRDRPVFLRGGILHFVDRSAGGLQVTGTEPLLCDIDDIEVLAVDDMRGDGLHLRTTARSVRALDAFRYERSVRIGGGVVIGGISRSQGSWRRGLHLENVTGPDIGPLLIRGRSDADAPGGSPERYWRPGSVGVLVSAPGDAAPVGANFAAPHIRQVETGLEARGGMEGLSLDGGEVVNCRMGVILDWYEDRGAVNPGFSLTGAHVNAAETCLSLRGVAESFVTGNLFYRFPAVRPSGETPWIGVDLSTVDRVNVSDNLFNGWSRRERVTTPSWPIRLRETKRSFIGDNRGYKIDAPIVVEGGRNREVDVRDNRFEPFTGDRGARGQIMPPEAGGVRLGWSY